MSQTLDCFQYDEVEDLLAEQPVGVVRVGIDRLREGPSLRLGGVRPAHVDLLVQSGGNWPAILVHQDDLTIIDGYYRYLAARQLGHTHMDCVYFAGPPELAFLEALRRNLHRGLPLSLREREGAAGQLVRVHPQWSDRRLGQVCGLAPATIRRLRGSPQCATDHNEQLNTRWGRDGRRHPVDSRASRARIITALHQDPMGSLRTIARAAGTSPATVRAVKAGLAQPDPTATTPTPNPNTPTPAPSLPSAPTLPCTPSEPAGPGRPTDTALLSTTAGRAFSTWFDQTSIADDWRQHVEGIPISRVYEIADEARRRAQRWLEFSSLLEARPAR